MQIMRRKKLYTHFELVDLSDDKDTVDAVCFESYDITQKYPTVKDFNNLKSRLAFRENPVKLTCFYEKEGWH